MSNKGMANFTYGQGVKKRKKKEKRLKKWAQKVTVKGLEAALARIGHGR